MSRFDSIDQALQDVRQGKLVIVVDNEDRENEGDLVFAASLATTELMAFTIRHTAGFICCAVDSERLDALQIPLMIENNTDPNGTQYTVTVDAKKSSTNNVSTGISAHDRAVTVRSLADFSSSDPHAFTRPGHIVPLRPNPLGLKARCGHTEATIALCKLAGLPPVGVLSELINEDGSMMRRNDCAAFAAKHNLTIVSIADLAEYENSSK
ncbi:hypothetical protein BB561_003374 [Smittium simulii]|uniref:3,4-dihydroxy-2-butanone 4-phosphate synthase n=1 Tax=Smittium simulii TaxID=133385 RepID=A0A2T9YLS9_9FUNG|nr:hypothetical protein BB561_003374 [Smittium simulii]